MKKEFIIGLICFLAFVTNAKAQINAWELKWSYKGTWYEGLLWYPKNGGDPVMRVTYYAYGRHIIEEKFETTSSNGVTVLTGYSPRFIYYENSNARYNPDNLVFVNNGYSSRLYLLDDVDDIYNPDNWAEITNVKQLYTLDYFNTLKATKYVSY